LFFIVYSLCFFLADYADFYGFLSQISRVFIFFSQILRIFMIFLCG